MTQDELARFDGHQERGQNPLGRCSMTKREGFTAEFRREAVREEIGTRA